MTWRVALALVVAAAIVAPSTAGAASTGACVDLRVGPPQEIVSDARRDALGLTGWPDGTLGILPVGDGLYDFYAMDAFGGSPRPQRTTVSRGTLDDPLANGVWSRWQVENVPAMYQWAGGAPIYRDPASGMILQTVHLERYHADPSTFWSVLGIGKVNPYTGGTYFLGEIISPELSFESSNAHRWTADLGAPSFTIADHGGTPWFHFYFADFSEPQPGVFAADGLSVAGAPVSEVLAAARRDTVPQWRKLYRGAWSEPGLGGRSDDLQAGRSQAWAPRVVRSRELGAYFMAAAIDPREIVLSTSANGISGWSPRVSLFRDPGYYNAYVTLAGTGGDPSDLGHDFYLYYTQWPSLGPDWSNARLMRRAIHCAPKPAPSVPPPAPSAPKKLAPRGIRIGSARVTWRGRRLHVAMRGRVLLPKPLRTCRGGRVRLHIRVQKSGKRLRLTRRVGPRCGFKTRGKWRLRRAPRRVRATIRFLGNRDLAPASRQLRLRVRRR